MKASRLVWIHCATITIEQVFVKFMDTSHHEGFRKLGSNKCLPQSTHLFALLWITMEIKDGGHDGINGTRLDQVTCFTGETNLAGTIAIVGDDGSAGGECLRKGARQTFTA